MKNDVNLITGHDSLSLCSHEGIGARVCVLREAMASSPNTERSLSAILLESFHFYYTQDGQRVFTTHCRLNTRLPRRIDAPNKRILFAVMNFCTSKRALFPFSVRKSIIEWQKNTSHQ